MAEMSLSHQGWIGSFERDGFVVLENVASLELRLHLDPCGRQNGPMRVIPGSHQTGRLDPAAITAWACGADERAVDCLVPAGGVVVMRPLLLHASSSGAAQGHRRVIHLEYAAESLPDGLAWYQPVAAGES
jgi:ectoine hydroxylase-related dioxygenase (phytanoyl-CoA dioxygenase family)